MGAAYLGHIPVTKNRLVQTKKKSKKKIKKILIPIKSFVL
jgi:hypothetical protein